MKFEINKNTKIYIDNAVYLKNDLDFILEKIGKLCEGIPIGSRILVCLPRNIELICSMFFCLKQKMTYVLLDNEWPEGRKEHVVEDCCANYVITTKEFSGFFTNRYFEVNLVDELILLRGRINFPEQSEIAYILYTSGSTGFPKGVKIYRRALINLIDGLLEKMEISNWINKRILCHTAFTFDIFFIESIFPVCMGMDVIFLNECERKNPMLILKKINNYKVEILQITPSELNVLFHIKGAEKYLKSIKMLMVGGEKLSNSMLQEIQRKVHSRIYNMYGPTEATVWVAINEVTNEKNPYIGEAIKGCKVYLRKGHELVEEEGERGEICIEGKALAEGYTDSKSRGFEIEKGKLIYRTGDIAEFCETGKYIFIGRTDGQIKYHGYRIELGDIENNILSLQQIRWVKVFLKIIGNKEQLVVAYVSDEEVENIQKYLESRLPEYMIPKYYFHFDDIPQNENGKANIKLLEKVIEEKYRNGRR